MNLYSPLVLALTVPNMRRIVFTPPATQHAFRLRC
jgi:hypothetical protein